MSQVSSTPKAVIFDMDGVIVDSEPLHERAFREVFAKMGFDESRHGIDFKRYYGKSDRALWLDFIEMHSPEKPLEELLAWKQEHFLTILRERRPIFPPIPDLVAALAARYPLAVASGSNHPVIDEVLAMQGLRRFFGVVVSVQDVARSKPFPDVFLRAAELLGADPRTCVVIEDSAAGVKAACDAGMRVIAITNTLAAADLTLAHHIVQGYDEIERLLLQ
ncbi:MAG: HAD family phosphatase [Verrucomicrobiales bacterium]|nr:HAD family phosphatase [Verrucomicrobiales bacterium]